MSRNIALKRTVAPASRHTRARVRSGACALDFNLPDRGHAARCRPGTSKGDPHSQWASDTWRGELRVTPRRKLGQNEIASEPGQQGTTEQVPTSPESGVRKRKTRGTASHAATHLVRRAQEEEEVSRQRATLPMLVVRRNHFASEALTRAPKHPGGATSDNSRTTVRDNAGRRLWAVLVAALSQSSQWHWKGCNVASHLVLLALSREAMQEGLHCLEHPVIVPDRIILRTFWCHCYNRSSHTSWMNSWEPTGVPRILILVDSTHLGPSLPSLPDGLPQRSTHVFSPCATVSRPSVAKLLRVHRKQSVFALAGKTCKRHRGTQTTPRLVACLASRNES